GGQVIDIEAENRKISLDELNLLQSLKTGALIKASCVMGCLIADREDLIHYAEKYTENVGRAFQIVDDILDVEGSFEELGKPIGSDKESEKSTYVSILGLDESKRISKVLTDDALKVVENFDNNDFLKDVTEYLLVRKN
ncbi:MAG: polyprenyl synthetase family protein, partial [Oscillospiraceae bacterium]|nr:polyprenyl synthetase family protein [Oscillospiraceae bacterium]